MQKTVQLVGKLQLGFLTRGSNPFHSAAIEVYHLVVGEELHLNVINHAEFQVLGHHYQRIGVQDQEIHR